MLDGIRKQLLQALLPNDITQADLLTLIPQSNQVGGDSNGGTNSLVDSNTNVTTPQPDPALVQPQTQPQTQEIGLEQWQELQKQLQQQQDVIRRMQANNIQSNSLPNEPKQSFDDIMLSEFITPLLGEPKKI